MRYSDTGHLVEEEKKSEAPVPKTRDITRRTTHDAFKSELLTPSSHAVLRAVSTTTQTSCP